MGHWNWWAPGPLARFHQRFGLSEAGPGTTAVSEGGTEPQA
jgi:RND superfamily putative drug exporter